MLPSATISAPQSSSAPLPVLPEDAVATSSHLQQIFAVRKLTQDLQQQKPVIPSHHNCLQVKLHTAVYKRKLTQYNNTLKQYEQYINQLLSEQATESNKILNNVDAFVNNLYTPSKLKK